MKTTPAKTTSRGSRLRRWTAALSVVGMLGGAALATRARADGVRQPYRLIVNPGCGVAAVDRAFVAQIFLKKVKRWPNGEAIQPVDLDEHSPVRRSWSSEVLSRSVEAVRIYWQQMIFSGRELPPPEMESDQEVLGYVLRRPGGIGYVSAGANIEGAKVVTLR